MQVVAISGQLIRFSQWCGKTIKFTPGYRLFLFEEHRIYILLTSLMGTVYLASAFIIPHVRPYLLELNLPVPEAFFGFNQLEKLGPSGFFIMFVFILVSILITQRNKPGYLHLVSALNRKLDSHLFVFTLAALFTTIFLMFRNEFINPDGQEFTSEFMRNVPSQGSHVSHDEMWEMFLHSRFWFYTHKHFNWTVDFSYQVLSSLAGGVFVYVLLRYCRRIHPHNPVSLFFLIISGGFMQLFFGDVENYTLTTTLIMFYFFSVVLYFTDRLPLAGPSALLALAMTFHLVAGFLLPSLAFLYLIETRRRNRTKLLAGTITFVSIIGLTLLFFHYHNLPIQNFYYHSHAFGHGGNIPAMLAKPSLSYYWQQVNLLALMFPASILFAPLLLFRRIKPEPFNIHLIIATTGLLIFQFTWEAKLGVYNDWNLYAAVVLPFSILVWTNLLKIPNMKFKNEILISLFSISSLHSYVWIISNHFQN